MADNYSMSNPSTQRRQHDTRPAAALIRARIQKRADTLWQPTDFDDLPPAATAQALSRLAREGFLKRVAKGVYYRPRPSAFGESRPSPKALRALAEKQQRLFPAGLSAANLLGFSTQSARHIELATSAPSAPKRLLEPGTIVHTRRPREWESLTDEEAALLDLLRSGAAHSELDEQATAKRLLQWLGEKKRFEHLAAIAASEPPRVQAILGAAGQQLGKSSRLLAKLREGLNPHSRFDFGKFAGLYEAAKWQAKEGLIRETA